jgi:hypothetical protein
MKKEPKGLAFLEKIARLVCDEHDFEHQWTQADETHILTVQCKGKKLTFHFARKDLDDPGSEEYRELAEKMLARVLQEFRSVEDGLDT